MLNALAALMLLIADGEAVLPALDTSQLEACGTVVGADALTGAHFHTDTGEAVKLALIKGPENWTKGASYRTWPYGPEARDALTALIKGQAVSLWCEGAKVNAEGERVAHAVLADGTWLQAQLVKDGTAFVFPRPARRTGLALLYTLEDAARADKRGLWAFDNLKPVPAADNRAVKPSWFQLIEGKVVKAEKVGPTIYLNFGEDWRDDVTIEIPANAQRYFEAAGINPLTFAGKTVEARGWIDFKAGPRLVVQGPGQIRLKDAD